MSPTRRCSVYRWKGKTFHEGVVDQFIQSIGLFGWDAGRVEQREVGRHRSTHPAPQPGSCSSMPETHDGPLIWIYPDPRVQRHPYRASRTSCRGGQPRIDARVYYDPRSGANRNGIRDQPCRTDLNGLRHSVCEATEIGSFRDHGSADDIPRPDRSSAACTKRVCVLEPLQAEWAPDALARSAESGLDHVADFRPEAWRRAEHSRGSGWMLRGPARRAIGGRVRHGFRMPSPMLLRLTIPGTTLVGVRR